MRCVGPAEPVASADRVGGQHAAALAADLPDQDAAPAREHLRQVVSVLPVDDREPAELLAVGDQPRRRAVCAIPAPELAPGEDGGRRRGGQHRRERQHEELHEHRDEGEEAQDCRHAENRQDRGESPERVVGGQERAVHGPPGAPREADVRAVADADEVAGLGAAAAAVRRAGPPLRRGERLQRDAERLAGVDGDHVGPAARRDRRRQVDGGNWRRVPHTEAVQLEALRDLLHLPQTAEQSIQSPSAPRDAPERSVSSPSPVRSLRRL